MVLNRTSLDREVTPTPLSKLKPRDSSPEKKNSAPKKTAEFKAGFIGFPRKLARDHLGAPALGATERALGSDHRRPLTRHV